MPPSAPPRPTLAPARRRRSHAAITVAAVIAGTGVCGCATFDQDPAAATTGVRVLNVVDGDTLNVVLAGERERVRLALVQAPEVTGTPMCGGPQATAALRRLITGHRLRLRRPSTQNRDRYGRLIREVLADGRSVDEQLVRDGWATQFRVPAGGGGAAANRRIARAAADARTHQRGVWKLCGSFDRP